MTLEVARDTVVGDFHLMRLTLAGEAVSMEIRKGTEQKLVLFHDVEGVYELFGKGPPILAALEIWPVHIVGKAIMSKLSCVGVERRVAKRKVKIVVSADFHTDWQLIFACGSYEVQQVESVKPMM